MNDRQDVIKWFNEIESKLKEPRLIYDALLNKIVHEIETKKNRIDRAINANELLMIEIQAKDNEIKTLKKHIDDMGELIAKNLKQKHK